MADRPRQSVRSDPGPQVREVSGVRSTAAVRGHPIHPALVPLPIGALVLALVTDVVFASSGADFWADASWWLLWAGGVTGVAAAAVGLVDFLTIERVRHHRDGIVHLVANAAALVLTALNLLWRAGDHADAILPVGLAISAVTAGLLAVSGWYGGELSYRHGVGVVGR